MNRRDVLKRIGTLSTIGTLAGCIGTGAGGGGDDGTTTDDGTATGTTTTTTDDEDTATTTRPPAPSVASKRIETTDTGCLSGEGDATVEYADGEATVGGAIEAPTPCYEATLQRAGYDAERDRVVIVVGTEEGDASYCQQCIGAVEYRATVALAGRPPGRIVVRHAGEGGTTTVATASTDASE